MSPDAATIYIIDDDARIRSSLSRLFRLENIPAETFGSAEEFLQAGEYKRPACLVSDVRMPGLSGLELQDLCVKRGIRIPFVFITGHGRIPMSVQAMKKGAVDFLPKPYSTEALLQAVNLALEKSRADLQQEHSAGRLRRRLATLSGREQQVLQGVIGGMLNKQIAHKLGISVKTVKVHRASVIHKMKATSVPHLVRMAEIAGI